MLLTSIPVVVRESHVRQIDILLGLQVLQIDYGSHFTQAEGVVMSIVYPIAQGHVFVVISMSNWGPHVKQVEIL